MENERGVGVGVENIQLLQRIKLKRHDERFEFIFVKEMNLNSRRNKG